MPLVRTGEQLLDDDTAFNWAVGAPNQSLKARV